LLWKKGSGEADNGIIHNGPESNSQAKLVLATLLNLYYGLTAHSTYSLDVCFIELLPILAHFANDTEEELSKTCRDKLVRSMSLSPLPYDCKQSLDVIFTKCEEVIEHARIWKSKTMLLRFLQVFAVSSMFLSERFRIKNKILQLLMVLVQDFQFDVRVMAADTFSGLLQCSILSVDDCLLKHAYHHANSTDPIQRHSGVLILAGIVQAYPYTVPTFLPDVLMALCKHVTDPSPIKETVKKALGEFKRTHQDSWHEHRTGFSEEQLEILTNLMVSANYYV